MPPLRVSGAFFQKLPEQKVMYCKSNTLYSRSTRTELFTIPFTRNRDAQLIGIGQTTTQSDMAGELPSANQENSDHETRTQKKFVPGSIHEKEATEYWQNELKAGMWVMEVLREGYVIPFIKLPQVYEERNNASAAQDMPFVRQAVTELKEKGIVEFVDEQPHCVSPLTVTKKAGNDGSIKKRLCWDGSRCVNTCIKEQKVTLAHFQRALEITRRKDFQIKYDLKSAYHHIKIHPSQTKYLGAAYIKPEGGIQYFVFLFLPFGLSSAVHCITKLFKPINAYIHERGIRHSIYLDDGRITADSEHEAEKHRVFVYGVLEKAGWILEAKKSDHKGEASQAKEYLGFIIDTVSMTVRLEKAKKQRILQQVSETIAYGSKPIPAKELAGTLGKIVATEPALGPVVIMAARAAYTDLDKATQEKGWRTQVTMSKESVNGLRFFEENCSRFDNTPIRSAATEISVMSIIGPPSRFMKSSFVANHVRTEEENIWASDASGYATCAYSIKGEQLYYRGVLTEEERKLSSGHRELLAVSKTLEYYESKGVTAGEATNVYWLTDSQNMVVFLTKGSGIGLVQTEVLKIMETCKRLNFRIIPIHLLREDPRIQVADDGSKTVDSDDWQVDEETFQKINRVHAFTIDLFASNTNTKCPRFYSNFYCQGTVGIEAFAHSWNEETAWICPPIREVTRIIRKLRISRLTGVLFVPEWKTADYWVEIFNEKGMLLWPFVNIDICRPYIVQGSHNYRSPFAGRVKFNFLAISFSSYE